MGKQRRSFRFQGFAGVALAILFACVLSSVLWRDVAYFFASPYPYGIDGYYYLTHVQPSPPETAYAVSRTGPPLAFVVMRALAHGVGSVDAIKWSAIAFLFLTGFAACAAAYRMTGSGWAALLSFTLIVKGFLHVELLVDFLKQSLGQFWLAAMMAVLLANRGEKTGFGEPGNGNRNSAFPKPQTPTPKPQEPFRVPFAAIAAAGCCIAAGFTHELMFVLTCVTFAAYAIFTVLRRRFPRWAFPFWFVAVPTAVWGATGAAGRFGAFLPKSLRSYVGFDFRTSLRLNLDSIHDTLGPVQPAVPLAAILTALLFGAVLAGIVLGMRDARKNPITPFLDALAAFLPLIALAYSPFLVSAQERDVGLALRLTAALSVPATLLIPAALYALPLRRGAAAGIAIALTALFAGTPPFWAGFPGPPADGGLLHCAMVETRSVVPDDAVIVTDARTGNMVNALWGRPRILASRFDLPLDRANYYRFQRYSSETLRVLGEFLRRDTPYPPPETILGPWILMKEGLYYGFRDYVTSEFAELRRQLPYPME